MKKLLLLPLLLFAALAGYAQCSTSFTATANPQGNNLLQYQFNGNVTYGYSGGGNGLFSSAAYTFGDGTEVTVYNGPNALTHTYAAPGTYTVSLATLTWDSTVSPVGVYCSDTTHQTITVGYPCAGTTISGQLSGNTLSYTLSSPGGSTGLIYTINFGDGAPAASAAMAGTHTYTAPGTYNICVTATGAGGCTYTSCMSVVVTAAAIDCAYNTASFTSSVTGAAVSFQNTSNSPSGMSGTAHWYFGDGYTNSGSAPIHSYATAGTYSVMMVQQWMSLDSSGMACSDTSIAQVTTTVNAPNYCIGNVASFSAVDNGNGSYTFSNTSTSPAGAVPNTNGWAMYNGNGSYIGTLYSNPATHTFSVNGTYRIEMHGYWTDPYGGYTGCEDSVSQWITVSGLPDPCTSNTPSFTTSLTGNTVTCNTTSASTTGMLLSGTTWSFGDDSNAYSGPASQPQHSYTVSGTYTITMANHWTSNDSLVFCNDTAYQTVSVTVNPMLSGSVSYFDSTAVRPDSVRVYLIQYDANTQLLSAVASQTVEAPANTYYTNYSFANEPAGTYLVKAVPVYNNPPALGFVPTYSQNSLYWNYAYNVVYNGGIMTAAGVYLQVGTPTTGPGFIGGNVSLGANKHTNSGVPGMLIFLLDASGNLVAGAYTDANGDYSFSNLPAGTYSVHPEEMNYGTTEMSGIAIGNGTDSVQDGNFFKDVTQKTIAPHSAGIEVLTEGAITLAPNPDASASVITWTDTRLNGGTATVINAAGQAVLTQPLGSNGSITLHTARLAAGIYTIQLSSKGIQAYRRLSVLH